MSEETDSTEKYFRNLYLIIATLWPEETFNDDKIKDLVRILTRNPVDEKVFKLVFENSFVIETQLTRFVVNTKTISIFLASIQVGFYYILE